MSDDALDVIARTAEVCANYLHEDYGIDLMKAHAQLLAEREAAAKDREDAARYRWLRNPVNDPGKVIDKVNGELPSGFPIYEYRSGEELDAAIDAARSKP